MSLSAQIANTHSSAVLRIASFAAMLLVLTTSSSTESQLSRAEDWVQPEAKFLGLDAYVRPDRAPILSAVASLSVAPFAELLALDVIGATETIEARADLAMGFDTHGVEVAMANVRVGPRFRVGAVGGLVTFTHVARDQNSMGAGGYARLGELTGLHLEVGISYQRALTQRAGGLAFVVNGLIPVLRHQDFSLDVLGALRIGFMKDHQLIFGFIELRAMFHHITVGLVGQFNGDGPQIGHLGISFGVYR